MRMIQRRVSRAAAVGFALAIAFDAAAMGLGNAAPAVGAITFSPSPVPALASASVTCDASDDAGVVSLAFTVSGGSLAGGAVTQTVLLASPQQSASATVAWSTPAVGSYEVTCAAVDGGGTFGGPLTSTRTVTVAVEAVADPPGVDALEADAAEVDPGGVVHLVASAHGDGIAFTWSASGGSIAGNGATATWTAPGVAGPFTVSVAVTDSAGRTATASAGISVVWARQRAPFGAPSPGTVFLPAGIAVDAAGTSWVTNPRRGEIVAFSREGAVVRRLSPGGWPSALAVGPDQALYVGDLAGGGVRVLSPFGALRRTLGASGALPGPTALAVHPATGQVFVGDATLGALVVFDAAGQPVATIPLGGVSPAGIALDPARGRMYVSDSRSGRVLILTLAGEAAGVLGSYGAPFTRPGGVALGPDGNVYVADAYQATVVVLTPAGVPLAYLGAAAGTPAALDVPLGVAADPRGVVRVTSTQTGKVESFALAGYSAPVCPGDADCDGLPDAWEVAHGLDPANPLDAAADPDGDGLTNADELALGTDPRDADSDGDGWSDGAEVAAGDDPLDARDHAPRLVAGAPRTSEPGLVRLGARLEALGTCSVAWTQVAGPPIELRGATTLSPSFVGRAAGSYRLEGVATCSRGASAPARLDVTVTAVPPRPDAGRPTVVQPGGWIALDGRFSWDGNGGPFSLSWDQTLGAPVSGAVEGATLTARATKRGLLAFQLTAADPAGLVASAEIPVLVVDAGLAPPTAVAGSTVVGEAGAEVRLDATGSTGGVTGFFWRQVDGLVVGLEDAGGPTPRFVPPEPGHYAFEVSALAGTLRSPPARVDVYVARAGVPLPRTAASATPPAAAMGEPVELDGRQLDPGVESPVHRWRQVSGPAAGLTDADQPVATFLPFVPGTFVLEHTVSVGGAVGLPARVTVTAGVPGETFPLAVAAAGVGAGDRVWLDGSASSVPIGGAARHRWTQVGGPWVALDDPAAPATSFLAPGPGLYVFELEVDDGLLRSAPATVSVRVDPRAQEGNGR